MEEIIMGTLAVLAGLVALVAVAGWIVPLILGIVGRRRQWPSAKAWQIVAIVWGVGVALLACGVGALIFISYQVHSSYEDQAGDAPSFDPAAYAGQTGALRLASSGAVECVFQDAADKSYRCVSSNGSLAVPAGSLTLRGCEATATDANGKSWTASFRYGNETALTVGTDAVQSVSFGPPFLLAAQVEYAPVSSKISLAPVCADRAGNIYRINSGSSATVPSFQLLDAGQHVVWSGKFEAG